MITQAIKDETILRLEGWLAYTKDFIKDTNRIMEARVLLMCAKTGWLNDRGWSELEHYVAMLDFTKRPEYAYGSNLQIEKA